MPEQNWLNHKIERLPEELKEPSALLAQYCGAIATLPDSYQLPLIQEAFVFYWQMLVDLSEPILEHANRRLQNPNLGKEQRQHYEFMKEQAQNMINHSNKGSDYHRQPFEVTMVIKEDGSDEQIQLSQIETLSLILPDLPAMVNNLCPNVLTRQTMIKDIHIFALNGLCEVLRDYEKILNTPGETLKVDPKLLENPREFLDEVEDQLMDLEVDLQQLKNYSSALH